MRSAINTLLVVFSLMVAFLASFSVKAACPIGIERKSVSWVWSNYGDAPYICAASCKSVLKAVSVCFPDADSCTGDFITNGSACPDSDGVVAGGNFPEPDNGGGDGDGDGGDNGGGDGDCLGGVCAYPADIRSLHDAINHAEDSSFNVAGKAATGLKRTQILAVRAGIVGANYTKRLLDKLDQVRTEHFADMDAALNTMMHKTNSIEGKMDSINTKVNTIATNSTSAATNLNDIKNKLDQLIENTAPEEEPDCTPRPFPELPPPECIPRPSGVEKRLDALNNTLINNAVTDTIMSQEIKASIEGMKNDNNSRLDTLNESLGSLESSGDANSQAEISAINGVGNKVDGLGGKLSSISQGIGAIRDALSPGGYQQREAQGKVDFESLPLYGQTAIDELEAETEQLKQDYDDKVKEFRDLFSFDTSKLNEGEYVEHSMTLTLANGRQASAKSGVFPALIDNSALISAVILFLAAVIGSRFIF
ncbi:hypothetical protein F0223_21315 [Vibrio coralliilyticus]|uniref:hypothetical protein n=1 Tax=Vibrio coralliilyticus TaxID=190893 RepID=UPI00148B6B29|nr:hypothetical protein [Vibrio coralliilyticus]NOI20766.1 hypothetical protein [Vibrio coralliilyticus]